MYNQVIDFAATVRVLWQLKGVGVAVVVRESVT